MNCIFNWRILNHRMFLEGIWMRKLKIIITKMFKPRELWCAVWSWKQRRIVRSKAIHDICWTTKKWIKQSPSRLNSCNEDERCKLFTLLADLFPTMKSSDVFLFLTLPLATITFPLDAKTKRVKNFDLSFLLYTWCPWFVIWRCKPALCVVILNWANQSWQTCSSQLKEDSRTRKITKAMKLKLWVSQTLSFIMWQNKW